MLGGLPAARWTLGPSLVTVHGDPRRDATHGDDPTNMSIRWRLIDRHVRAVGRHVDCVVSPTPDWSIHFDDPPARFVHIPHLPPKNPPPLRPFQDRDLLAVYVGGAQRPIKNFALLAAAWPRVRHAHPHAKLDLVGWLPPAPTVPGIALPVDTGVLERDRACERIARARALVVPSKFEVAPIAIIDAWAVGTAVVGTAVGGIPAMLGGAGFLVPANDTLALADALAAALAGAGETAAYVEEGLARVRAASRTEVVAAHERLYAELCGA